ncbi:transglutaminase-like domain-containing protein [Geothrix terrae]|uniref:transglutaminase-like domain-containing protein n=1 Tax=Geothrix terrae TaxID=2922720 RepID=UPI001FABF328|nr:transglutaminase family protein [Geothrix terrae]
MIRRISAFLLAFSALTVASAADGPDLSYSKTIHYQIKGGPAGYRLSSETTVQRTALTERAARAHAFDVVEQPFTTVSGLRGESRGRELKQDRITFHFPRLEDTFIPPARVHELEFPADLKIGDTITYSWHEDYKDLAFLPIASIPAIDQVVRFEIRIDHPADLQITFAPFFPHGDLPFKEDRSAPTRTVLVFQNLPRTSLLPCDPYQGLQAAVLVGIHKGAAPLTPGTPSAFSAWYLGLLRDMPQPSAAMNQLLSEELRRAATPREKARILFDYVKSEIRYIADEGAMHAFIPHDPASVLEKKYGDCKDKAWLLTALARIHGLSIHPVLLSTVPPPDFHELAPGLFNHVICALEEQDQLTFMDPTATYSEMGDLPDLDLQVKALVLDPARPRLVTIPSQQRSEGVEIQIEGDLAKPREAKARITLRHSWRAQAIRSRRDLKSMDLENTLSNRLNRLLARLSLDGFRFKDVDREKVILEANADLTDFFIRTDLRVYAPSAPFRAISPDYLEREGDTHPLDAQGPDSYRLELDLKPDGLRPRPDRLSLGRADAASHTATCSGKAGNIRLSYTFRQPFRLVPKGARAEFMAFCTQYLQLNRRLFVLQRSES